MEPKLDRDVLARLRTAAAELQPVVVEIGPERLCLSSYVESLRDGTMVLGPIAAKSLPERGSWVRIRPASGCEHWSVTAPSFERDGASRARVRLSGAQLDPAVLNSEPAGQATDLLALVVPGGIQGFDSYVFPVRRISAHECEILTNAPIAPGRQLPRVEIVGDRRLLRRASAIVLETIPWVLSNGSATFGCRMSLAEPAPEDPERQYDLVTDHTEVRRLLTLAAALQVRGWYESPGRGRGVLQLRAVMQDRASFELVHAPTGQLEGATLRIGVELFATEYELEVRPLDYHEMQLTTALPLILRRRLENRRDHRVPLLAPHRIEVSFRHPVTAAVELHEVTEVSFFGLSFVCTGSDDSLWPGLPLEVAELLWQGHRIALGDVVVEEVGHDSLAGGARCSVMIPNSAIADDATMIDLLATLAHPNVRVHDGHDFVGLHEIYLRAGLFGPHMSRNLLPLLEQTKRVWFQLHSGARDVVRTFVHGPEHAPDAAVTVMRAWEHAFVLQHFVDTSPELAGATGRLQAAYLDHVVPRPDGRYLVFFIKTDNHIMNAYLRRFFASTGTPDAVTRCTVELWMRPEGGEQPIATGDRPGVILRACEPADEPMIGRGAQRLLGAHAASALSFRPSELHLPDTRKRFARADLERSRRCDVVTSGDELAYALVEEISTPGVNLTWMLNATWVLPLHPDADPNGSALDAALESVVSRPAQSITGDRFINAPQGLDPARMQAWGFHLEAELFLYVVTRAGLHRLFQYTSMRCGEVEALAARRDRRRKRGPAQG